MRTITIAQKIKTTLRDAKAQVASMVKPWTMLKKEFIYLQPNPSLLPNIYLFL